MYSYLWCSTLQTPLWLGFPFSQLSKLFKLPRRKGLQTGSCWQVRSFKSPPPLFFFSLTYCILPFITFTTINAHNYWNGSFGLCFERLPSSLISHPASQLGVSVLHSGHRNNASSHCTSWCCGKKKKTQTHCSVKETQMQGEERLQGKKYWPTFLLQCAMGFEAQPDHLTLIACNRNNVCWLYAAGAD